MMTQSLPEQNTEANATTEESVTAVDSQAADSQEGLAGWVSAIGYILAVSYPVLAISTGTRAVYQLFFKDDVVYYLPVLLSGVAALCYLLATIGFAYRRRWSWWLSVGVLLFETAMTLIVGVWSFIDPPAIGSTVWRHFGADYGFFPFFQPLLGLIWLFWPATMREYGIGRAQQVNPRLSTQNQMDAHD